VKCAHRTAGPIRAPRITAEQVERPKPAPDLFLYAARCLKVEPSQVVVVEDTPTGIAAARAAGMYAIGFAGLAGVNYLVRRVAQLSPTTGLTPSSRLLEAGADVLATDMPELKALLTAQ